MAFINILDEDIVLQIITDINSDNNRDRRALDFKAHEVEAGNQLKYTKLELQKLLPKSWEKMRYSDVSISKKVIKKIAKAYKSPPQRSLTNDNSTELLNDIYKASKINKSYKEFDKIYNLHRHGLMWVNYRQLERKYQFMPMAPYLFNVVRDQDTGVLDCVILNYPDAKVLSSLADPSKAQNDSINQLINDSQLDSSADSEVYVLWTRESHVAVRKTEQKLARGKVKISIDYLEIPGNPEMVNPLGIIPFVYLSQEMSVDNPIGSPLTQQSVTFNTLWSDLLSAASGQGFGILTLKYPESMAGQMENMTIGLTTGIELPQSDNPNSAPTEAAYINPNPDLAGQKEVYLTYLQQILAEHGITSSQAIAGSTEQFSSGLDRLIAQADVQDVVNDNQDTYQDLESEIFSIVRVIEREVVNNNAFSDKEELTVIYPKPKVLISDKETLENIQKRLDLGLIEKWEALVMLDPNMSEEAAREKLLKIEEERMQRMEAFAPQLIGPPSVETPPPDEAVEE